MKIDPRHLGVADAVLRHLDPRLTEDERTDALTEATVSPAFAVAFLGEILRSYHALAEQRGGRIPGTMTDRLREQAFGPVDDSEVLGWALNSARPGETVSFEVNPRGPMGDDFLEREFREGRGPESPPAVDEPWPADPAGKARADALLHALRRQRQTDAAVDNADLDDLEHTLDVQLPPRPGAGPEQDAPARPLSGSLSQDQGSGGVADTPGGGNLPQGRSESPLAECGLMTPDGPCTLRKGHLVGDKAPGFRGHMVIIREG